MALFLLLSDTGRGGHKSEKSAIKRLINTLQHL